MDVAMDKLWKDFGKRKISQSQQQTLWFHLHDKNSETEGRLMFDKVWEVEDGVAKGNVVKML